MGRLGEATPLLGRSLVDSELVLSAYDPKELVALARDGAAATTLVRSRSDFYIDGFFDWRTRAINALIKKIKRIGHGYRNSRQLPVQPVLNCGVNRHTP